MPKQKRIKNSVETNQKNSVNVALKLIVLIYFFSGICSLIDEVVWVRLLKLTLGNTVYASSIVVSVFMGGLALGSLIMSRYADQIKKRLLIYAVLEVCATIAALSLPLFLKLMDGAYQQFYVRYDPSPHILLLVQVIVSAILLLIPAMVMGSTLPLLGRYVTSLHERVGRLVGRLYALNMLGAALGCFLAGFILIRTVGVMGTIYIAAGINLLVAISGFTLSRSFDITSEVKIKPVKPVNIKSSSNNTVASNSFILMIAFFCSGLISIGYELLWMRSIVFVLGGPTYVFAAVLTIYLLGNVLGAWIGSILSKRLKYPAVAFGISLTCLGILGIFYINWLDIWQSDILSAFVSATIDFWESPMIRALFFPIFNSFFLFFIPAVAMGIGFPFALQAWSNYRHKVGQTTGVVYGVNTIGAVLGGLLVGFLFIPFLGVQRSVMLLGLTGLWLGIIIIIIFSTEVRFKWRISYLAIAVSITIVSFLIPSDLFKRQFISYTTQETKVLAVKEGINTTVSVHEGESGELTLATSGIKVAGDYPGFSITQKILGHLGIFLNKNTNKVLSVGFGTGESANCLSKHDLESIDIIEIAPELVDMSLKYFSHINSGEQLNEKNVHIKYMDAKNYLHLTDKHYDLIITDATNPRQIAENASLYTLEYFQNASDRLSPGGILGCWLPVNEIPVSCINSILGTIKEAFPYVTIWISLTAPSEYNFLYVVGSNEPQLFSPAYIDNELNKDNVRQSVEYINFYSSHDVLSCYICDQDGINNYLKDFNLNSDYTPFVEFNTDKNIKNPEKILWLKDFLKLVRQDNIYSKIDWSNISEEEQNNWIQVHKLYHNIADILINARVESNPLAILQSCFFGLKVMPDNIALKKLERHILGVIRNMIINNQINIDNLINHTTVMLQKIPVFGNAWLVRSWALYYKKDIKQALFAAENAVKYYPNSAMTQHNLGSVLMSIRLVDESIVHLKEAVKLEPENETINVSLGMAYTMSRQYDDAISQFRYILKLNPLNYKVYYYLGDLYNSQGKRNDAISAYTKALQINPNFETAKNKLSEMSTQKGE
jgi:spermidine synthase